MNMINRAANEAAVRRLEATARRQEEALEATRAQIAMFRELIQAAELRAQEIVKNSKLKQV